MDRETKLNPCPWCGPLEIWHKWSDKVRVRHNKDCPIKNTDTFDTNQIAAWNRRAPQTKEQTK